MKIFTHGQLVGCADGPLSHVGDTASHGDTASISSSTYRTWSRVSGRSNTFKLKTLSSMLVSTPAQSGPMDPLAHWASIYCVPALR